MRKGLFAGLLVAALAAGCTPASRQDTAAARRRLTLAGVVDEADAMAWSGQVELAALAQLLGCRIEVGAKRYLPSHDELCKSPAKYRGTPVGFSGKLVAVEKFSPLDEGARLGALYKGVVLLADGALVAFRCKAPTRDNTTFPTVEVPRINTPVKLAGRFLKRWVAMDARGKDYVVMPLVAAHSVTKLAGPEADKLARTRLGPGKLPLKELHAPEVWSRPVVELAANGALRLDGKLIGWRKLEETLAIEAARYRNPLGDSSLAVVVLADPRAPKPAADKLRKLPKSMGAKCIFRTLAAPTK